MIDTIAQHNERIYKISPLTASPIGIGIVKSMTVKALELELTPVDALSILERVHPKQRKPSLARVRNLLLTMNAGKWHEPPFTADSIAFDSDGYLVNGLHRMLALSKYTKSLRFLCLVGVKAPDEMPLPECDGVLPRRACFIEDVNRNDWGVGNYIASEVLGNGTLSPRFHVKEIYDFLYSAIVAIPDFRGKYHQPVPVRAAFVFEWHKADAIFRVELEEQWRYLNTLRLELCKPGIAALYRALDKSADGSRLRINQFAQTIYAIDKIDFAQRIYPNVDGCRKAVREYLKDIAT